MSSPESIPAIRPVREQAEIIHRAVKRRLDTILPRAMRETGIDMWVIICQEDNLDPVFSTMIPLDTWCPILQILVFFDRGSGGVERINLSATDTHDLFDRPWNGRDHVEQWPLLRAIIEERDPKRIGINTGSVQWAAGGLTHNLYGQLVGVLPEKYRARLVSAELLATRYLATLTHEEIGLHEEVVAIAHGLLAECYSRRAITPGVTTVDELQWYWWQRVADLGLEISFKPYFFLIRSEAAREQLGEDDRVIRPGDFVRSDVGIRYLRLHSDHQQWAYVLRTEETGAPPGFNALLKQGNRLQDIFMAAFRRGLTGNELLGRILARAREEGLPEPKVYSHSLGLFLHEPGPLIGLPWEQERCPGRGDVRLDYNYAFTMELSVSGPVPEWNGEDVRMALEEDVVFTEAGCRLLDDRQTEFYLV